MKHATTTRREMLMGLALASTTAATATLSDAGTPTEDPELLRLGDELPKYEAEYLSTRKACANVYHGAMANWPHPPSEVIRSKGKFSALSGEIERDVAGDGLHHKGEDDAWGLWRISDIEERIDQYERDISRILKSKRQKGLGWNVEHLTDARKTLPIAKAYWSKCECIRKASGYNAASTLKSEARDALHRQVNAIMQQPEQTMLGVVIKAQALASWGKVETFYRNFNIKGIAWPNQMAEAIIRQAGASA